MKPTIMIIGNHRVVTTCICPPIPDRRWDWIAHIEGEEEKRQYGYGCTESDAVRELLQMLEDDDSLAGWWTLQRASLHIDAAIGEDRAQFGNRRGQGYYLSLADASNLIDDLMEELQEAGEVRDA